MSAKRPQQANASVRAAFVHVMGDLLQSVSVVVSAVIIFFKVSSLKRPAETPAAQTVYSERQRSVLLPVFCPPARVQDSRPHLHLPVLHPGPVHHLHHHERHPPHPHGGSGCHDDESDHVFTESIRSSHFSLSFPLRHSVRGEVQRGERPPVGGEGGQGGPQPPHLGPDHEPGSALCSRRYRWESEHYSATTETAAWKPASNKKQNSS